MAIPFVPLALSLLTFLPPAAAQDLPADERPLLIAVRDSLQRDPRGSPEAVELSRRRLFDLQLAQLATQRLTEAGLSGLVVACRDGHIELRGEASDADLRERATELAAGIPGVVGVQNALVVPGASSDATGLDASVDPLLAAPVQAVSFESPAAVAFEDVGEPEPESDPSAERFGFLTYDGLAGRDLRVDLRHGLVRLRGEVNSSVAKMYASTAAQSVPGVQAVLNELVVVRATQEESRRLALIVQKQIEYDPYVQAIAPMVLVKVRDGVVRLEGSVQDDGQRQVVEELAARQAGVFAVENWLEVDEDLMILPPRRSSYGAVRMR